MNRRIKKKIKKRLQSGPYQFDVNRGRFCPIAKTYREIKNERKAFHKTVIWYRHIASKLIDYSYRLHNRRRLRTAWKRAFYKNF